MGASEGRLLLLLFLSYGCFPCTPSAGQASADERQLYIDPRDTVTLYQSSRNPMDILNGTLKVSPNDLIRMKMTLEWADSISVDSPEDPRTTVVESMLGHYSGGPFIYPEPEPAGKTFVSKSVDWRISTALGLHVTEALARAFQDRSKGSMLYRQTNANNTSYVRYLNDINQPALKEGYRNGKLDWVETRDKRWNGSILPWDVWAPQNGYREITFSVQRNGYGYGLESLPSRLAAVVLFAYVAVVVVHIIVLFVTGRIYQHCSDVGELLALALSSPAALDIQYSSRGVQNSKVW